MPPRPSLIRIIAWGLCIPYALTGMLGYGLHGVLPHTDSNSGGHVCCEHPLAHPHVDACCRRPHPNGDSCTKSAVNETSKSIGLSRGGACCVCRLIGLAHDTVVLTEPLGDELFVASTVTDYQRQPLVTRFRREWTRGPPTPTMNRTHL